MSHGMYTCVHLAFHKLLCWLLYKKLTLVLFKLDINTRVGKNPFCAPLLWENEGRYCCCSVHLQAVWLQAFGSNVINSVQLLQPPPPAWTVGSCWQYYVTSIDICHKGTCPVPKVSQYQICLINQSITHPHHHRSWYFHILPNFTTGYTGLSLYTQDSSNLFNKMLPCFLMLVSWSCNMNHKLFTTLTSQLLYKR